MIRFVVSPDRVVIPDLAARLPGRGMWLSARADVLDTARARGAFARAAKGPVIVPADLKDVVRAGLARRVADHVGLCRRAGQAVAGFTKARDWLEAGRARLVLQASDGSEDERRRLLSGAKSGSQAGAEALAVAWPLDAATLGGLFGRDRAVHVAVAHGQLADGLINEIERLGGVSGQVFLQQAGG